MFLPAKALNEQGIETIIGEYGWRDEEGFVVVPTISRLESKNRGPILNPREYSGDLDVVIMKLWMWHEARDYIKRAQDMGQTIIIDIDDWFDGLPTTNIAFETTHPKRDALWNRNHMLATYRDGNGLICSTDFLYNYYKSHNKNVHQVYNALNPESFFRRWDSAGRSPVIGWVGIMLWRTGDIQELKGWLGPFLEKHDLRFHHAGINPENPKELAEIAGIDPERLTGTTGCTPQLYGNILLPIDIGIVPLNTLPFNEAKSNLKGLEYAFTGSPFVAHGSGEYKKLEQQGAGRTATRPRDWIKQMEKLLDPEERKRQSDKNYQVVSDNYDINKVVYLWIETIEKIVASNPKARIRV